MNRDPLHRRFARAATITALNPFAQLARLAGPPSSRKHLRSEDDIPGPWKKSKPDTKKRASDGSAPPIKKQKVTPVLTTPQKAKKPTVVPVKITPKKKKPIKVELKPKMTKTSYVPDDEDDVDMAEHNEGNNQGVPVRAMATMRSGESGGKGALRETPITPQDEHFGLPETKTVVLTQTQYFAMISKTTQDAPVRFQIRLNTPTDWMTTFPNLASPAAGNFADGFYSAPIPSSVNATWTASQITKTFPNTASNGNVERPQWRKYWEEMYQYYTVLGVEYEITFQNPQANFNADQVVATFIDSYSASNATNVHPQTATMAVMEQWPDVNFIRVPSCGDGDMVKGYKVIKGFYRPGQNKNSVENDEDIKTWTKVKSLPSLTEVMTVLMAPSWDNAQLVSTGCNVRVDMRWIVQYKDLFPAFRWPFNQTAIPLSAPADILFSS